MQKLFKIYRFLYYRIYLFYVRYELADNPALQAYLTIFFIQVVNMLYFLSSNSKYGGWSLAAFITLIPINSILFKRSHAALIVLKNEFKHMSPWSNRLMDVWIVFYILGSFLVLLLRSGRIH